MVSAKDEIGIIVEPALRGVGRDRILDEARGRYLAKGFSATSMQEIADAVGMTKPALYYHFRDKHELFLSVIAREMEQGKLVFAETMKSATTLHDRLEAGAIWCFTQIGGDIGQMMSDLHRFVPADKVAEFKVRHAQPADMVAQMLEIGRERGEIGPDEDIPALARLFVAMIFGQLSMIACQDDCDLDPERLGKLVARVFMEGVGTSHPS